MDNGIHLRPFKKFPVVGSLSIIVTHQEADQLQKRINNPAKLLLLHDDFQAKNRWVAR
jgi:hypothetical protein